MGRLQRKKPTNKKKKKSQSAGDGATVQQGDVASEQKGLSLAGFSRDVKKKQSLTGKILSAGLKPVKQGRGDGYLEKGMQFLREVRIEFKKVTWPPRNQVIGSTVVVIILVMVIALFLGAVDIGLSNLVRVVLR